MQISPRIQKSDGRSRRGGAFPNAFAILIALLSLCTILAVPSPLAAQVAGPLTVSSNPNYFKHANGTVVTLNGSQNRKTRVAHTSCRTLAGCVRPLDGGADMPNYGTSDAPPV